MSSVGISLAYGVNPCVTVYLRLRYLITVWLSHTYGSLWFVSDNKCSYKDYLCCQHKHCRAGCVCRECGLNCVATEGVFGLWVTVLYSRQVMTPEGRAGGAGYWRLESGWRVRHHHGVDVAENARRGMNYPRPSVATRRQSRTYWSGTRGRLNTWTVRVPESW